MSELYSMLKAKKTGASSGGGGGATVNNATITIQKNGTTVDSFTSNQATDKTINITVPTSAADVTALPDTTKYAAALSLTINSSTFVMTGQLKDQNGDNLGTAQTIDLPLESVVVNGSYNSQTKKVVLTLQNGNTIEFSVADLVSGLQTELSASNKLNPAYINYDSTHRAVSDTEKSTWNSKQNAIDSSHKLSADLVDDTSTTNKFATAAELEQIETNKNNILLKQDKALYTVNTLESGTYTTYTTVLTYTTPSKPCVLIATAYYSSSSPTGIRIGLGSNNVLVGENTNPNGDTMLSLTTVAFDGGGNTVTVQAKSLATGTLKASLTVIPLSTTQ